MSSTKRTGGKRAALRLMYALLLLGCGLLSHASAQEQTRRYTPSLTSEDLLNRPVLYTPPAVAASASSVSTGAPRNVGSTYYRDPSGAFTLSFPNGSWRLNTRGASAGRIYSQRSFRRMDADGFASATANVYVLTERTNFPLSDPTRLDPDGQRGLASTLAARFLSSNATVVSVEPSRTSTGSSLRIIADQTIARRVAVRAFINVFERGGRLYVVVCSAPAESFDALARDFEVITSSLASSAARS